MEIWFNLGEGGMKPEAWAAWVQAIGSIAALAIAIWVPARIQGKQEQADKALASRMERQRLDEAEARARSYALRLMKPTGELLTDVAVIASDCREEDADDFFGFADRLSVPEEIEGLKLVLHELGGPGIKLQTALVQIEDIRIELNTEGIRRQYSDDEDIRALPTRDIDAMFRRAQALLDSALEEMRGLFQL